MARKRLTLVAMLLAACSGGTGGPDPEPVASVTIAPANPTLVPLQTTQLSATLKDAAGATLSGRSITWSSSATTVASVSGTGLVTAVLAGTTTVTASSEGRNASVTVTVRDGSLIGVAGGQATGASGKVTITVPAGALPTATPITIVPVPNPPVTGVIEGTAYDFGPEGLQFTQPVIIRIKYDPGQLGSGANPAQFRVAKLIGNTWTPLPGSSVDVATATVTGQTSSFSEYGVVETPAPVQTVVVAGQGFIVLGQAVQFTATLSDAGGHALSGRVVTWSSSNGTIASVSSTGLVTGLAAGGPVTITATSEGKSGSAPITVTAPVQPVFVRGRVIDFTTQNGIANATVNILDNVGVVVGSATTQADGSFSSTALTVFQPASGGFVQAQATGYVSARVRIGAFTPGGTTVAETVPLVPQSSLLGGISGTVRNARTSLAISGANISLTIVGDINFNRTTTSDGSGNFSFTQLQAGTYNLDATATDFSIASRTGVAVGNSGVTPGQDIILSPSGGSEVRIVLTWGSQPSDLDSHLTGPSSGGGRFHVYFASRGSLTAAPFAALDLDDVSGNGPETITIAQFTAGGVYRYSVHDFSNRTSTTSSALGSSGAKVQVYDSRGVAHDFFVPGGAGTLWTVFELTGPPDNPVITPVNTMGFADNSGGITTPPAVRGSGSDAELIGRVFRQSKPKPR
jgi:carboxypeptidase family protein/Big-like domain-containing protein